jgi:hypothetical protein
MPTLAAAAGVPAPARSDGVSLLPALSGQGAQRAPRVYVEYFHNQKTPGFEVFVPSHRNRVRQQMQALTIGEYVGVRYNIKGASDDFEIYDAVKDPKQAHNLAKRSDMAALQRQFKETALRVRRPSGEAKRPYDDAPVPPVAAPTAAEPGVRWRSFAGPLPWVPQFETLTAAREGRAEAPQVSLTGPESGQLFDGYLEVPADGKYTFILSTDGGAVLRLHEATVIDADFGFRGGSEVSGEIVLKAGRHPFRLAYARRGNGQGGQARSLKLEWSGPGFEKRAIPPGAFTADEAGATLPRK